MHRKECQIPSEKQNIILCSSTWCSDLCHEGCLHTLLIELKHDSVWNTSFWIPTLRENFWLWSPAPWRQRCRVPLTAPAEPPLGLPPPLPMTWYPVPAQPKSSVPVPATPLLSLIPSLSLPQSSTSSDRNFWIDPGSGLSPCLAPLSAPGSSSLVD